MKTGILLVAQGGAAAGASAVLQKLEARVQRRFPDCVVRRAYTSARIRQRLAAQGQPAAAPAAALRVLRRAGCARVAVAPLHVAAGWEYDRLRTELEAGTRGRRGRPTLAVSPPLLGSATDLRRVVRALLAAVPAERRAGDAVIFMGHGNAEHPGALAYLAAAAEFQRLDALAFLATLEGEPRLGEVLTRCRAAGARKAYLIPFMALAGDHVRTDMAGTRPRSWTRVLARSGIEPAPDCRGLFERPPVVALWLRHLAGTLQRLAVENVAPPRGGTRPRRR